MLLREGYYPNGFEYKIFIENKSFVLREEKKKTEKRFRHLKNCQKYIDNKIYEMARNG